MAVYLNLPIPTLDIIGWEDTAALSGDVTLSLPVPALLAGSTAGGAVIISLPIPALQATGTPGVLAGVALSLPTPALVVAGTTGTIANVALQMPSLHMAIGSPNQVMLALPTPALVVAGTAGISGSATLRPPVPTLASSGLVDYRGDVALSILPVLAVAGTTGTVANISMALRALALAAQGYTGTVGDVTMVLPIVQLASDGSIAVSGDVVLSLPMLVMRSSNTHLSGMSSSTVVMHTESNALTTYSNYQFNSFAQFNGVYLGANDSGIFALSGATDNGVLIDAAARVGITDFSTSHLKRVDRCYVGYRTDGNMVLRVITDEINTRDYLLTATGKAGLHGNHVRIGKGLAARYWQFEIRNKDGSDFTLDTIELKPTPLRRRVGGGDA